MSKIDIQGLAERLANLDRVDPSKSEEIKDLELRICDYELSLLKKDGVGNGYFPLLGEIHQGKIPIEELSSILHDALIHLLRNYDPEKKATFATALSFLINKRAIDYFNKTKKKQQREISAEEIADGRGNAGELGEVYEFPDFESEELGLEPEVMVFVRLAPLVVEQREMDARRDKSKRVWFESFYTFDVTKLIKKDRDCAEDALKANDYIFPAIEKETRLLKFLLNSEKGNDFSHIRELIERSVNCIIILEGQEKTVPLCYDAENHEQCAKCIKLLDKRNKVFQKYYNTSKPTVCTRNDKYFEKFKQAVYGH